MRLMRGLLGGLLEVLGALVGLLGVVLCVTVILLSVGVPLLAVARRLLTRAVQLMLPHALAHPVDEAKKSAKSTRRDATRAIRKQTCKALHATQKRVA